MSIRITSIEFESSIPVRNISTFRGALIALSGNKPIYHNHTEDSYIYAYPLIQYKIISNTPTIIGIGAGADHLDSDWEVGDTFNITLGRQETEITVISKSTKVYTLELTSYPQYEYILRNWLPFNRDNYQKYKSLTSLTDRIALLNRVLVGNILSLYKGLDVWVDNEIITEISEIIKSSTLSYKGTELICLDIKFSSNTKLPENCGLGKAVSKGNGIISKVKNQTVCI